MADRPAARTVLILVGLLVLVAVVTAYWLLPGPEIPPAPKPTEATPPVVAEPDEDGIVPNPAWTGDLDGMVERRQVRVLVVAEPDGFRCVGWLQASWCQYPPLINCSYYLYYCCCGRSAWLRSSMSASRTSGAVARKLVRRLVPVAVL